jgi:hypothetical protein
MAQDSMLTKQNRNTVPVKESENEITSAYGVSAQLRNVPRNAIASSRDCAREVIAALLYVT